MNNRKFIFITLTFLIVIASQFLIFAMRETKSQSSDLTSLIPTDSIRIEKTDTIKNDVSDTTESNKDVNGADTTYEYYEKGIASWYGDPNGKLDPYHGRTTACGYKFDTYQMWAAHKTLRLPKKDRSTGEWSSGQLVRVTNLSNGKSIIVEIVDRGPFVRGRVIDLSWAAKNALDMDGTTKVLLEKVIITEPETHF